MTNISNHPVAPRGIRRFCSVWARGSGLDFGSSFCGPHFLMDEWERHYVDFHVGQIFALVDRSLSFPPLIAEKDPALKKPNPRSTERLLPNKTLFGGRSFSVIPGILIFALILSRLVLNLREQLHRKKMPIFCSF